MRFGVCCSAEHLEQLKNAGYDYAEFNFSKIATCPEEEFEEIRKQVLHWGILAEAYNGFFPGTVNLNVNIDYDYIRTHSRAGFARAKELGGKVAVLGSGGARMVPEGYDRSLAGEQFLKTLDICGDEARKQDMVLVVEPLRARECNFINTVEDGMYFARTAAHPNVKCLADFFHVSASGESLTAIEQAGNLLGHVHLAMPETRFFPAPGDEEACKPWIRALKTCGYDLRISLEGKASPDFETAIKNAKTVLEHFR